MRTYKLGLVVGNADMLRLDEYYEINGNKYWESIGLMSRGHAARFILMMVLPDSDSYKDIVDRFERHFLNLKERFPRIITTRDVLHWLGNQVSAAI